MGFLVNHNIVSLSLTLLLLVTTCVNCDSIKLPDQIEEQQQQQGPAVGEERRQGKHLLDFIGLGTGHNVDPYMAKTNSLCLNGELSECFKSQAIGTFNEFFAQDIYPLTPNARIVKLPETQVRSLQHEGFEFSSEPRNTDSEWDQLFNFGLRKLEKFVKSTALEFQVPEELTEGGRYSPRFIDEISDEIDVIEDKKATLFSRNRLKKVFIPLLIILKIFKLKLLLFLPLILGLASFKKILGFLAIVIPGVIGYLKIFRPNGVHQGGGYNNDLFSTGYTPQYSPQGVGTAGFHPFQQYQNQQHYSNGGNIQSYRPEPSFAAPYGNYYRENNHQDLKGQNSVKFGDDLAYQGYSEQYRSNDKNLS